MRVSSISTPVIVGTSVVYTYTVTKDDTSDRSSSGDNGELYFECITNPSVNIFDNVGLRFDEVLTDMYRYVVANNSRHVSIYSDTDTMALTLSKNYETVNLTKHTDDLLVESYYGFLPYADTQNPYIEEITIKDAIITELNNTTYYVYNGIT